MMKIKYPTKRISYGNLSTTSRRGMSLEQDINESNDYYLANDIAVIYKKPTPVQVVDVSYPSRNKAVITKAFYKIPSTTDYNGIYKGKYIDFEAKETKRKFFPLINIHSHQIEHLKKVWEHGAIAFIIVRFSSLNETYYLDISNLTEFLDNNKKSFIPHDFFVNHGHKIIEKFQPRLDYLNIIDDIYFKGEL